MQATNHSNMGDALLYTALCYYAIGITLIITAFWVWYTHPINRVFLFGEYVTEEGMRAILRHWPMVFLFGAFVFSCAVEHHAHWVYASSGKVSKETVRFFGIVEAVISSVTAIYVLYLAGRFAKKIAAKWLAK